MMNIKPFFDMGEYNIYVWTAYLITFAVFAVQLFFLFKEKKTIKKLLKNHFTQHE